MNIREIAAVAPLIPVLTVTEAAHAVPLARAMVAGGLRVLEVALQTPAALACIDAMRKEVPEAIIGAGTLTRPADFAAAGRVGAQFGATPGLTPELAAAARGARFPVLPGVMTPSDVLAARHLGFKLLRLFPADLAGGVRILQALAPLFPDVEFCPGGGISRESASHYLALTNVLSISVSWVAPQDLMDRGDWAAIEELARDAAALAKFMR